MTVAPDGSYSCGPQDISAADCLKASFDHCLALPAGTAPVQPPQQQRMRMRVVHNLLRRGAEHSWQLDSVELHLER